MLSQLKENRTTVEHGQVPDGGLRAVDADELRRVDGGWVVFVGAVAWGAAYAYAVYDQFD